MIECEFKTSLPILNLGVTICMCRKHIASVNDDICSTCPDRWGEGGLPIVQLTFPKRGEEEIAAIYTKCQACPLFQIAGKQCSRIKKFGHPVDVYAQNPVNRCPEGVW